jgi:hypothetical protein
VSEDKGRKDERKEKKPPLWSRFDFVESMEPSSSFFKLPISFPSTRLIEASSGPVRAPLTVPNLIINATHQVDCRPDDPGRRHRDEKKRERRERASSSEKAMVLIGIFGAALSFTLGALSRARGVRQESKWREEHFPLCCYRRRAEGEHTGKREREREEERGRERERESESLSLRREVSLASKREECRRTVSFAAAPLLSAL